MKILILNPVLFTGKDSIIQEVNSIKDTMIAGMYRAWGEAGHQITLLAIDDYRPKDIAKDGDMGYMFKSGDAGDLALRIKGIIHLDENQKREKCRQAHEYVTTEYDVSQTAQRHMDLYNLFLTRR